MIDKLLGQPVGVSLEVALGFYIFAHVFVSWGLRMRGAKQALGFMGMVDEVILVLGGIVIRLILVGLTKGIAQVGKAVNVLGEAITAIGDRLSDLFADDVNNGGAQLTKNLSW